MSTLDEINAQRDQAIAVLNAKIGEANDLINKGASGMDSTLSSLTQQEADLDAQSYEAGLDDPSMVSALSKLKSATADMNAVAKQMTTVTSFIDKVGDLKAATGSAVSALKGA